jgi:hypothetical protein
MNKLVWLSIPQLTSCRVKIERADENILNLQSEITAFLESKKNDVVSEIDLKTGHGLVKFVGDLSAVRRFSVVSGEIAYHLRSSLDHLVWRLINNPANRSVNSCFPVYHIDPRKLSDASAMKRYDRKVMGVSATAAAIIERIQPYNEKIPANNPLFILNHLNIVDKHHELVLTVARAGVKAFVFRDQPERRILNLNEENALRWLGELKHGAELMRTINLIGKMDMEPEIALDIAFAQVGLRQNEPVVLTLSNLRDAVTNVIELFANEKFV